MINYYLHDRLVEERALLLSRLAKLEKFLSRNRSNLRNSFVLKSWEDAFSRLLQINSILELNP